MTDAFDKPTGECTFCHKRPATEWWTEGTFAYAHGLKQAICGICCFGKQIWHAEERVAGLPALKENLKVLLEAEAFNKLAEDYMPIDGDRGLMEERPESRGGIRDEKIIDEHPGRMVPRMAGGFDADADHVHAAPLPPIQAIHDLVAARLRSLTDSTWRHVEHDLKEVKRLAEEMGAEDTHAVLPSVRKP